MTRVAESLELDIEQVKRANLYKQGDVSPTVSINTFEVVFHFYNRKILRRVECH